MAAVRAGPDGGRHRARNLLAAAPARGVRPQVVGIVVIAVALPALLLGGLIYVSPWHRDLAIRLMSGAAVVLVAAVVGPLVLRWLQDQLTVYGARVFGGVAK